MIYRDQNECFQKLFKYPKIENPNLIIRLAVQIKDVLIKKSGKDKIKEDDIKQIVVHHVVKNATSNLTDRTISIQDEKLIVNNNQDKNIIQNENKYTKPEENKNATINQSDLNVVEVNKTSNIVNKYDFSSNLTNKEVIMETNSIIKKYLKHFTPSDEDKIISLMARIREELLINKNK